MRQIDFAPQHAGSYQIIRIGLALSDPPRTAEETRTVATLFEKLDAIGEAAPKTEAGYMLRRRGGGVLLEEVEHAKLLATTEAAPILPIAARMKLEAIELVKNAPVVQPQPVSAGRKRR